MKSPKKNKLIDILEKTIKVISQITKIVKEAEKLAIALISLIGWVVILIKVIQNW